MLIAISILLAHPLKAQVQDSFADGEIHQNPTWLKDSAHFKVTSSKELQLDAPSQDASSSLVTSSQAMGNARWSFYARLDFNPSGSNFLDVYVAAPLQQLDSSGFSSYFIRIGDTEDEISLYKQTPSSVVKLIDGPDGMLNQNPAEVRVELARKGMGNFTLKADPTGGTTFDTIGSVYDSDIQASSYFGFNCHYTATRSDRFFFDDIMVTGSPYQDSLPPKLDTLTVPEKEMVGLHYNEFLNSSSFQKTGIELQPLGLNADSLAFDSSQTRVKIHFSGEIPNDSLLTLKIPPIEDSAGNQTKTEHRKVHYLIPDSSQKGAVVINELMVDPNPPVGLPKSEYLELKAVDSKILDLHQWRLKIGSKSIELSKRILRPSDRVLLIASSDSSLFDPASEPIYLDPFPALPNGGAQVVLEDSNGKRIDSVAYEDDWYRSTEKDDGGWSLERIDPGAGCSAAPNWKASEDSKGGTPGRKNSVHQKRFDQEPPDLLHSLVDNEKRLRLRFDERVESDSDWINSLHISHQIEIETVKPSKNANEQVIQTKEALDSGIWYRITGEPVPDCFGNRSSEGLDARFILPFQAQKRDVVINELLYDPEPDGKDFVEIYNRSDRVLDMSDWELARYQDSVGGQEPVGGKIELLRPGGYRFLSESPKKVGEQFHGTPLHRGIKMDRLPTYPNDSGTVILTRKDGKILDRFSYNSAMQHALIQDPEGVSLERLDPEIPSSKKDNWHSAASSEDYGTPGEENSQFMGAEEENGEKRLWSEPDVFTPDMDGDRDQLRIHYRFSRSGMNCSIEIYDANGRKTRNLANGELLEQKGSLIWDGTRSNGKKAAIGIYVIVLECIHPEGQRILEKNTCVLGTRW